MMEDVKNIKNADELFAEYSSYFQQYNFVITDNPSKYRERNIHFIFYMEEEDRFCVFIDEDKRDILGQMIKDYLMSGEIFAL